MEKSVNLISGAGKIFHKIGLSSIYKNSLSLIEINKGESLLDVGCGRGKILSALENKYWNKFTGANLNGQAKNEMRLFGIDPDPEKIQIAKSLYPKTKISFKIAYGNDLPFVNNSLDWVISTLTFHHMSPDEKQTAIKEISRVLKYGGKLLITDFGRPKNLLGNILLWISKGHAYTRNNMSLVERFLNINNLKMLKTDRTWGWVEHILCQKT